MWSQPLGFARRNLHVRTRCCACRRAWRHGSRTRRPNNIVSINLAISKTLRSKHADNIGNLLHGQIKTKFMKRRNAMFRNAAWHDVFAHKSQIGRNIQRKPVHCSPARHSHTNCANLFWLVTLHVDPNTWVANKSTNVLNAKMQKRVNH